MIRITLSLNQQEEAHLEALLATGLYGTSIETTAHRLLDRAIERELTEGILWKPESEEDHERGF